MKGFCTHELFTDWMMSKFIPYLASQRQKYNYIGKAIIIMDGFKGHEKSLETLDNVLKRFNLKIILIPPHSSDQVQPLDLFGFNLQKSKTQKYRNYPYYRDQANQILAIIDGLNEIRSPHSIKVAWELAGIYRERNVSDASPDETFRQYHIIEMRHNTHIRELENLHERIIGSLNRRIHMVIFIHKTTSIFMVMAMSIFL